MILWYYNDILISFYNILRLKLLRSRHKDDDTRAKSSGRADASRNVADTQVSARPTGGNSIPITSIDSESIGDSSIVQSPHSDSIWSF